MDARCYRAPASGVISRGTAAEIIAAINASPAPVLAVDIPSGAAGRILSAPGSDGCGPAATATFGLAMGACIPRRPAGGGKAYLSTPLTSPPLLRDTGPSPTYRRPTPPGPCPQRRRDSHKVALRRRIAGGWAGMSGAAMMADCRLPGGLGLSPLPARNRSTPSSEQPVGGLSLPPARYRTGAEPRSRGTGRAGEIPCGSHRPGLPGVAGTPALADGCSSLLCRWSRTPTP